MNNMRNKILMTLALLITAVSGAWAQNVGISEMTSDLKNTWTNDEAVLTATDLPGFVKVESDVAKAFSGELPQTGFTMIIYAFSEEGKTRYVSYQDGVFVEDHAEEYTHGILKGFTFPIYYISESGIEVTWDAATKTGTFTMPAFDVELTPLYAPEAKWATDGDKVLAPTAVEGVIAGTEDAIVKAGTVVEGQGTVMYFATTDAEMTAEKAAKAEGWLSTLPTAAGYDDAQTVYVWYYIKGADTPDGQTATAENTFNDSEICTTPIAVKILSNKFDIQFKAANDNTIQAGKATVKVGETAAQVDEKGNLTGVKMNSKVTVTAKDGYKFRKAEAKKKSAAAPTTTVTWNSSNVFNSAHEDVELAKWSPTPLSYEGITISFSGTKASSFQAYDEDDHIGSLTCYGNYDDSFTFTAPSGKKFCKIEIINNGSIVFTNYGDWTRDADNKIVWSGTAATAVTLGSVYTDADDLNSIVFYLSE